MFSKSKALHDSFTHCASIVWNCLLSKLKSKPSYSSFKASIKKFSKRIDLITFGSNYIATNYISDEFMKILISSLLLVTFICHPISFNAWSKLS